MVCDKALPRWCLLLVVVKHETQQVLVKGGCGQVLELKVVDETTSCTTPDATAVMPGSSAM